jgi:hypothetical protein
MGANERTLSLLPEPPSRARRHRVTHHADLSAQLTVRALRLALSDSDACPDHVVALARLARGDRNALLRALQRVDGDGGEGGGVDIRARTLLTKALERVDATAFDERQLA